MECPNQNRCFSVFPSSTAFMGLCKKEETKARKSTTEPPQTPTCNFLSIAFNFCATIESNKKEI